MADNYTRDAKGTENVVADTWADITREWQQETRTWAETATTDYINDYKAV